VATRDAVPAQVTLRIEGWTGTVEEETSDDALVTSLQRHMDAQTQAAVDGVSFTGWPLAAAVAAPITLIVGLAAGLVVLLILIAVGLGIYAGVVYQGLDGKRATKRAEGEVSKQQAVEELRACLVEVVDYREEWRERDAQSDHVDELLATVSPSQFTLRRDDEDAREVIV